MSAKVGYNWKDLDEDILKAMANLEKYGFKEPTIRSIYYVLGSLGKIPLTTQGYKQLDSKIVKMRKEGVIDWGFFAVKRGRSIESESYVDPQSYAQYMIHRVKNAHDEFTIPRWFGQPHIVEVWIEKDGLLGAIRSWTSDQDVTVRAPQGYGAWEFIYENVEKIKERLDEYPEDEKPEVHILYLGDLDPSGKDIPRFMSEEALEHFELEVDFREIALTPDQVKQYNLPEIPDAPEVREKIGRDPRLKGYVAKYGELFCELDAFFALAPVQARELVQAQVESFFDEATYDQMREREDEEKDEVKRIILEKIDFKEKDEGEGETQGTKTRTKDKDKGRRQRTKTKGKGKGIRRKK